MVALLYIDPETATLYAAPVPQADGEVTTSLDIVKAIGTVANRAGSVPVIGWNSHGTEVARGVAVKF